MSGPSGSQTSTTSNAPPQQYLDAYSQLMTRANQVASTPYQNYPGQLQAGFSPQQQQGFDLIGSTVGEQQPYLNTAAQAYTAAAAPLQPLMQPYVDQAQQYYENAGNQNLQGALSPYQGQAAQGFGNVANANLPGSISQAQQAAYQGFGAGSQTLTPQQYSADAVQNYYSPYQKSVVDATQKQFDLSNATQQNQLRGNAASNNALGGDRVGVAQAALAGQQQTQQAPVIAGLMNQGFGQAQQEFNNQQQTNLTAAQQSALLKQQAAQGYTALGNQSLAAAQGQAGLQSQAAQGFAGLGGQSLQAAQGQAGLYNQTGQGIAALGQQELGAGQSQGWLNAQAGSGLAGLGNEALQGTLASGNALLGAGGIQQQQAQQSLNIPYQQWQAALSYPFQTTGWLGNLAEGLGGSSGSTGTSTTPGPSVGSQVLGAGALAGGGAYLANQAGLFGGSTAATGGQYIVPNTGASYTAGIGGDTFTARGGAVHGFAGGGGVPDVSVNGVNVGEAPGSQSVLSGGFGVPDVSTSIIPGSNGLGSSPSSHGTSFLKKDYGNTSTATPTNSDSTFGSILKTAGAIAATAYGGPAGGMAANALGSQVHFQRGGHVPILSRGFAAGGAPVISVTTVPNPHGGLGIPTMSTAPDKGLPSGDAASPLNAYLNQTAAGAFHGAPAVYTPPPPPPAPVAPPQPFMLPPVNLGASNSGNGGGAEGGSGADAGGEGGAGSGAGGEGGGGDAGGEGGGGEGGGGEKRGGTVRGFDGGGDVEDWTPPSANFGTVDDQPVGQRFTDWLLGRSRDTSGQAIPTPPVPPGEHNDAYDTPLAKQIVPFLKNAWAKQQAHDAAFKAETSRPTPGFGAAAGLDAPERSSGTDDSVANPDRGAPPPDLDSLNRDIDPLMNGRVSGVGNQSADDTDMPVPPIPPDQTPAGPAGTTTSGGFGTHGPAGPPTPASTTTLASGDKPTSGFAAYNDPMPWNPATMRVDSKGFGSSSSSKSDLDETRALKEDRANPWLSLMLAGAGMMAGTSPHAMTNIGQGAALGIGNYIKTDQAAKELAAKVQENKVRLAETQAYHGITGRIAQQNADTRSAAQGATAAYKAFQMANPRATPGALMQKTVDYLTQSEGLSPAEAWDRVKGLDIAQGRLNETVRSHVSNEKLAGDRVEIAQQHLMDTAQYREQVLALRQAGLDQGRINSIMNNATRNVVGDPAGRLTLDAAVKAQTSGRATVGNQGNQATPATPVGALRAPTAEQLEQARAAIPTKGRDAVIQRMQAAGYDTSGL